jgi:hypothetical protein
LLAGPNPGSAPTNNQINEEAKNQIKEYFKANDIFSISLESGKLIIVYNNKSKSREAVKVNNRTLQQIKSIVKSQPNQSLSLSELQTNITNSSPNGNNNGLYQSLAIGAVAGGVILVGFVLVFRQYKKKSSLQKN